MKDVAKHDCRFPARKIDGEVFVGECKVCGASVAAAALAIEAERDDLMDAVTNLETIACRLWDVLSPMLGEADRRLYAREIDGVLGGGKAANVADK